MRRLLLTLALLSTLPAQACVVVYGSGRNSGTPEELARWNDLNKVFHAAVVARIGEAQQEPVPLWLPIGAAPPVQVGARLLAFAQDRGCRRIVDAAVFADADTGELVLRLLLHPVLGGLGPRRDGSPMEIGAPIYTSQRDFSASNLRALEAERLKQLAREMVEELLPKL
ncbi:MAG TPA: hypothetical protein VGM81_25325 [Burkholderiaceae bacterium]|jgi:hypothetical protein